MCERENMGVCVREVQSVSLSEKESGCVFERDSLNLSTRRHKTLLATDVAFLFG